MKDNGVRPDDPEYAKAYNILAAVQQQKTYAKQRQIYHQQQQAQAQHQAQQRQQQQDGPNPQGATNGINGKFFYLDIKCLLLTIES